MEIDNRTNIEVDTRTIEKFLHNIRYKSVVNKDDLYFSAREVVIMCSVDKPRKICQMEYNYFSSHNLTLGNFVNYHGMHIEYIDPASETRLPYNTHLERKSNNDLKTIIVPTAKLTEFGDHLLHQELYWIGFVERRRMKKYSKELCNLVEQYFENHLF